MSTRDTNRGPKPRTDETRGRKTRKKKEKSQPLPVNPPALCNSAEERAAYRMLRKLLASNPRIGAEDVAVVADVACLYAYKVRLSREVRELDSLTVHGGNGQPGVHPLVKELRATSSSYRQALGQLLLSPRSRTVSKVNTKSNAGQPGGPVGAPPPSAHPSDLRLFGGGGRAT